MNNPSFTVDGYILFVGNECFNRIEETISRNAIRPEVRSRNMKEFVTLSLIVDGANF